MDDTAGLFGSDAARRRGCAAVHRENSANYCCPAGRVMVIGAAPRGGLTGALVSRAQSEAPPFDAESFTLEADGFRARSETLTR